MTDFVGELTKRLLIEAGIESGMRVLDVGCGQGDVSLLVAGLVGERGKALGVDRDARAVVAAGERARALGLANASFAEANLTALPAEYGGFDAIVGRRVLMYQPDAAAAIKHLVPALEPGGVMFFLEHDATVVPTSKAPLLLHERVHHWIWETVRREGANIHMGAELRSSLARAAWRWSRCELRQSCKRQSSIIPSAISFVRSLLESSSRVLRKRMKSQSRLLTSGSLRNERRRMRLISARLFSALGRENLRDEFRTSNHPLDLAAAIMEGLIAAANQRQC